MSSEPPADIGRTDTGGEIGTGGETGTAVLTIVVDDGKGTTTTHHLSCGPPGGDHPDPQRACRVLAERGERALPPIPAGMQCLQRYGGPQTAQITGEWRGQEVNSRLSRRDGCEIARWDALVGLLPHGGN